MYFTRPLCMVKEKKKTMLYAKHINTKANYCGGDDNNICCPIIFISKEVPPKKFINK